MTYKIKRQTLLEIIHKANADEEFALDVENKFQSSYNMAKEYNYSPIYFRHFLRVHKSNLFQHRMKTVSCLICNSPKNIRYRRLMVLHRKLLQKPFCSRKCYIEYLKKSWEKRKYALHRFYVKAPMSKWPPLLFGKKQAWYKTHLVIWRYYCLESNLLKSQIDYPLMEKIANDSGLSFKYVERCIQRGKRAEKRRGSPYAFNPITITDLVKFNYRWRYPSSDTEYKTIWSWVDNVLLRKR